MENSNQQPGHTDTPCNDMLSFCTHYRSMKGLDLLDEAIIQHIRDKKTSILNTISQTNLQLIVSHMRSWNILSESENLAILSKPSMFEQASAFIDKILDIR